MKAKRLYAPEKGKIQLEEYELPAVGRDQVLVKEYYTAISPGTEIAFLHGAPNTPNEFPFYPGYNACGVIEAVGEDVVGLKVGDMICQNGKHASYNVVDANQFVLVPEGVSPREATVFRLASIALQGLRKIQIQIGDRVAILGLGPVGNLAVQTAKLAGALEVDVFDISAERRELALKCGADHAYNNLADPAFAMKYDVVVEASGARGVVPSTFEAAKKFGKVLLLGCTRNTEDGVNFYKDILKNALTVVGAHEFCRPQVDNCGILKTTHYDDTTMLNFIGQGRINTDVLISEVYSPENAQEAYDRLYNRDPKLMLVSFDWSKV